MTKVIHAIIFISTFFLLVGYSGGPGAVGGLTRTNAPGESGQTCASGACHSGNAFDQSSKVEVFDQEGSLVESYMPNEQYEIRVTITAGNGDPDGYGFQMVSLFESDDSGVNSWMDELPDGIQLVNLIERDYVEHQGKSDSNIFSVGWIAPEEGKGSVSFYTATNAVNGNGARTGDDISLSNITITEDFTSPTLNEIAHYIQISPNPVTDVLNIKHHNISSGRYQIQNIFGVPLQSGPLDRNLSALDVSHLPNGIFLCTIYDDEHRINYTQKLIKN